jgi:hypothetical protein
MIALFTPTAASQLKGPTEFPLSTWFDQGGVLIARPSHASRPRFAVALKAGHNAEHHNHNDVGSYVASLDGEALLLDPGSMVYTADTFSSKRYRFAIMNSYGHPVPIINGKLQQAGSVARAKVLILERTDDMDTFGLDLTDCYDEPNLESLKRTWTYDRRGDGALRVVDQVTFREPGRIETALVGVDGWRIGKGGKLYLCGTGDASLCIDVACDQPYDVRAERIENPGKFEPVRVGLRLLKPVQEARITLVIAPTRAVAAEAAQPIAISRNVLTVGDEH